LTYAAYGDAVSLYRGGSSAVLMDTSGLGLFHAKAGENQEEAKSVSGVLYQIALTGVQEDCG